MFQHADPIVANTMKQQNPIAIRFGRTHQPAPKQRAIGSLHIEFLALRMELRKRDGRLVNQVWR